MRKIIFCLVISLIGSSLFAQCPLPPSAFVGEYNLEQITPIHPQNGVPSFNDQIVNLSIGSTTNSRVFSAVWSENLGVGQDPMEVSFLLDCNIGDVVVDPDLITNLSCGAGTITLGPASTTGSFINNDDSTFTLILAEYVDDGGCGVSPPLVTEFTLTRVTCFQPQNIEFLNATSTSVEVSWLDTNNTSSTGNTYTVEYGLQGFSLGSGLTVTGISGNSTTINNLQPDTAYDFYVSASCTDGTSSQVAGPFEHEFINNSDFTLAANGVTCLCPNANVGDSGTLNINSVAKTFTKRTRADLDAIIANDINDPEIALTCTSGIIDMSSIFSAFVLSSASAADFNQDLSHWDVSNVTDMTNMFVSASSFNQPLNSWDVSNVTSMFQMFAGASSFNQPLDNWDVGNVTTMQKMFLGANSFNQPLNNWDVSNVTNMVGMFGGFSGTNAFNQPLDSWDVSNVVDMAGMFRDTEYNHSLNSWNVSNVVNMASMFYGASSFNQPLSSWDVSNVTNMVFMFQNTPYNQPLDTWNVVAVTNMDSMFANTNFDQNISGWCVEQLASAPVDFSLNAPLQSGFLPNWGASCNIQNTEFVLGDDNTTCLCPDAEIGDVGTIQINGELLTFTKRSENMLRALVNADINNQQIALTCTSAVTDMSDLFKNKTNFNQTLEHWDVSNVTDMSGMFENATSFNIPTDDSDVDLMSELSSSNLLLSEWDVSNVTNMDFMFKNATLFNQDISSWCVEQIPSEPTEFSLNSALQDSFKPNWGATCTFSVQDVNFVNIKVYPNPTSDKVYIENPNTIRIDKIKVFNMLGKVVQEKNNINQNQTNMDLSELATGTYIVQILTQDAQKFVKRVIKK